MEPLGGFESGCLTAVCGADVFVVGILRPPDLRIDHRHDLVVGQRLGQSFDTRLPGDRRIGLCQRARQSNSIDLPEDLLKELRSL